MELDNEWIALAKAIRLKDFQEAEIAMDCIVRSDRWCGRQESIAKGRADAEVILRNRLHDDGAEFVAPDRAAA